MKREMLLKILTDPEASHAEKDDAVIELGEKFQDTETVDLLIKISNESNCDEMIRASCGESIGQIWLSTEQISYDELAHLNGIALVEALSLIKSNQIVLIGTKYIWKCSLNYRGMIISSKDFFL